MSTWLQGFFGTAGKGAEMDKEPLEAQQADLEDSNIAGIGSEEDRELRMMAAQNEKEYKGAGSKPGLEVWRVENRRSKSDTPIFGVKRWPKADYGSFYSGDSYIVMNTYRPKDPLTGKPKDQLAYDIHFWIGSESSQDERGVAAYKTVELDNLLGDVPVQHRETQYHESSLFLSYFKEVVYMNGGFPSGFRSVKPEEYEPRLFMVRTWKKTTKAFQIPCAASNLNNGDAFVLDAGLKVYRFLGESTTFFERNKSGLLASNIVSSRNGKAKKAELDEEFWNVLGGSEEDVRPADDPYLPEELKSSMEDQVLDRDSFKLFRISDESGSIQFTLEAEGSAIPYRLLDPEDVFILVTNLGLWIWLGSKATRNEKSKSMAIADEYIEQEGFPANMPVNVLREETATGNHLFTSLFTF